MVSSFADRYLDISAVDVMSVSSSYLLQHSENYAMTTNLGVLGIFPWAMKYFRRMN